MCFPQAYGEILFPETATRACFYFMDDMAAAKVWTFLIRFLTIPEVESVPWKIPSFSYRDSIELINQVAVG